MNSESPPKVGGWSILLSHRWCNNAFNCYPWKSMDKEFLWQLGSTLFSWIFHKQNLTFLTVLLDCQYYLSKKNKLQPTRDTVSWSFQCVKASSRLSKIFAPEMGGKSWKNSILLKMCFWPGVKMSRKSTLCTPSNAETISVFFNAKHFRFSHIIMNWHTFKMDLLCWFRRK